MDQFKKLRIKKKDLNYLDFDYYAPAKSLEMWKRGDNSDHNYVEYKT